MNQGSFSEPSGESVRVDRRGEHKLCNNDLGLSVAICDPGDKIPQDFAEVTTKTRGRFFQCMVSPCCANVGDFRGWCARCGRLVCKTCLPFQVTNIQDNGDGLHDMCIECLLDVMNHMDPSNSSKRIILVLEKVHVQVFCKKLINQAREAQNTIVRFEVASDYQGRLLELNNKIRKWQDEISVLLDDIRRENGEISKPAIPPGGEKNLEQECKRLENELKDLRIHGPPEDSKGIETFFIQLDILQAQLEDTQVKLIMARDSAAETTTDAREEDEAPIPIDFALKPLNRLLEAMKKTRDRRKAHRSFLERLFSPVHNANNPLDLIQAGLERITTSPDTNENFERDVTSVMNELGALNDPPPGLEEAIQGLAALIPARNLEELTEAARPSNLEIPDVPDSAHAEECRAQIVAIKRDSTIQDDWPLPFGLVYPTERMKELTNTIRSQLESDLEPLRQSCQNEYTALQDELVRNRDRLQETAGIMEKELFNAKARAEQRKLFEVFKHQKEGKRQEEERVRQEEERVRQEEEDRLRRVEQDASFARQLFEEEEQAEKAMMESFTGRAWRLVREIQLLHERLIAIPGMTALRLLPVAVDDIVFLTENFLACQSRFTQEGKPTQVVVGYHYTKPQSINNIRTDGLMSGSERRAANTTGFQYTGAVFGDGIYTANNPDAFRNYGEIGLLVAVLKGNEKRVTGNGNHDANVNTVVGNKISRNPGSSHFSDEIVLRQAAQCVPLLCYSRAGQNDTDLLWRCHEELQLILDEFFNNCQSVTVTRIYQ